MIRFLLILALTATPCFAQFGLRSPEYVASLQPKATGGGGSNPPSSPLVNQNFEGAGYDNSETWNENGFGTKDEDYATSPAPLLGSQSLEINIGDSSQGAAYTTFSAGSERWGFCLINITSIEPGAQIVRLFDSGVATVQMSVNITATKFNVTCGTSTSTDSTATFSANTTYYLWWHYVKGAGANATAEAWFSATSTKPADASANHVKVTDGSSTSDAGALAFGTGGGAFGADLIIIYDHTYIDDEAILSNP